MYQVSIKPLAAVQLQFSIKKKKKTIETSNQQKFKNSYPRTEILITATNKSSAKTYFFTMKLKSKQVFHLDQLGIAQSKPLIVDCAIFVYTKLTNLRI